MSSTVAPAFVLATGLWIIAFGSSALATPKRPAGEAWVVTASDKMPNRPMLARAAIPYKVAAR